MGIAEHKIAIGTVLIALSSIGFSFPETTQSQSPSPDELVRRVIQNEQKAEREDNSHWMFRLTTNNKNGQQEVDQVVETKDGDLKRPILINGRELTAKQRQEADRQLGPNAQALRKNLKDKNQDAARSQQMLKMIPDAFTFSYAGQHGDLVEMSFKPNPKFHPSTHEAEVFHAMQGTIGVDAKQNRLAEISGHLVEPVKFGGGFLGHLDRGGTFQVKQEEVAPGYWELTVLNVEMNGRVLFFKSISVHEKYTRSEFKRVPDNLTIAQAAEMLRKQPLRSESAQR